MAIRFDAAGDCVSRSTALPSLATFTISWWGYISTDVNAAGDWWIFIDGVGGWLACGTNSDGTTTRIQSNAVAAATGTNLTPGTWYHFAFVKDGANTYLYLNGNLDINRGGETVSWTPVFLIAMFNGVSTYINGRQAYVKVWSGVALTQADVQREMNVIRPVRTDSLHAWWPMFPGASERLLDYSGNGRTLEPNGTLTDEDPPPVSWGASLSYVPLIATTTAAVTVAFSRYRALLGVGI